jgi:hypothetical protein
VLDDGPTGGSEIEHHAGELFPRIGLVVTNPALGLGMNAKRSLAEADKNISEASMLMHAAPRSVSLAIRIPLVLACTLLLFPTAAMTEANQSRASTDNSLPSGLVVVLRNNPDRALDLRPLNNPTISGARSRSIGATSSQFRENRTGRSWINFSMPQNLQRDGYNSSSSLVFFLLDGPSKGQRPNRSQYNMDLAKAQL